MHGTSNTRTYVYSLGVVWASMVVGLGLGAWFKVTKYPLQISGPDGTQMSSMKLAYGAYALVGFGGATLVYFFTSMLVLSFSRASAFNRVAVDLLVLSIISLSGLASCIYVSISMPAVFKMIELLGTPFGGGISDAKFGALTGLRLIVGAWGFGWFLVLNVIGVLVVIVKGTSKFPSKDSAFFKTVYEMEDIRANYVAPGVNPRTNRPQEYMPVNPDALFGVPFGDTQLETEQTGPAKEHYREPSYA